MVRLRFILAGLLLTTLAGSLNAQDLTVSAAVSLKEAVTDIAKAYKPRGIDSVRLNFAATGVLLAQIREGAPVDVFIAASESQMDLAVDQKLVDADSRRVIASNALVLIVPKSSKVELKGFLDLAKPEIKKLAVGEPRIVPAGEYAAQVLVHLKLDEVLQFRLVLGASVRQVLDYVEQGEVDAGIVYATDAAQAGGNIRVIATAETTWHAPIHYPAAVVTASKHRDAAGAFIRYLTTEPAQKILQHRGFAPPSTQPATHPTAAEHP